MKYGETMSDSVEKGFIKTIKQYERVIYKVCYMYTTKNASLEDLYQEVVYNIWKAYPKFREESTVSTWIYRIALNTCISFIRKEKNAPEIVSLTYESEWMTEKDDGFHQMLDDMYRLINQLGQLDKSIILLYLEDRNYDEIALITGLSSTNVSTKISRIKEKLKRMKNENNKEYGY